ncbi:MAG: phosphoglycerate kinase [Caldilineaceae bacterium]
MRIQAALPTIQYLLDHGAAVVLMSHLGRPKGGPDPKYSMKVTADHLATLIDADVSFCPATVGPEAEAMVGALKPGQVLVLENTRFEAGETKNNPELAAAMAKLGDVFVNDAFGSAHRAHASTTVWPPICLRWPGSSWRRSWNTWAVRWKIPSAPSLPSWVGPRFPTRSASSKRC